MSSSSSSSSGPFIPHEPVPLRQCDCPPCEEEEDGGAGGGGGGGGVGDPQTKSYTGKDQPDRVPDVVRGSGGVRLYDGKIVMESPVALMSRGLNIPFGTQLEYNSTAGGASTGFGSNWVSTGPLGGLFLDPAYVLYLEGANRIKYFQANGDGTYSSTYFVRDRLLRLAHANPLLVTYRLTSPDGSIKLFDHLGKLKSIADPYGNTTTVGYDTDGTLATAGMTAGSDSFQYDYTWSSPTGGNITSVIYSANGDAAGKAEYSYESGLLRTIKLYDNTAASGDTRAPSSRTTLPGGRPGITNP